MPPKTRKCSLSPPRASSRSSLERLCKLFDYEYEPLPFQHLDRPTAESSHTSRASLNSKQCEPPSHNMPPKKIGKGRKCSLSPSPASPRSSYELLCEMYDIRAEPSTSRHLDRPISEASYTSLESLLRNYNQRRASAAKSSQGSLASASGSSVKPKAPASPKSVQTPSPSGGPKKPQVTSSRLSVKSETSSLATNTSRISFISSKEVSRAFGSKPVPPEGCELIAELLEKLMVMLLQNTIDNANKQKKKMIRREDVVNIIKNDPALKEKLYKYVVEKR